MQNETPTLIEKQLEELKSAGANIFSGQVQAHKPGEKGANRAILEKWLPAWIRNSYLNFEIARNSPGLSFLKSSAKGLPAVVVGIGPSLDHTVERLINFQRNCIIISTDAALRPLTARKIKPHIVVNVDASDVQEVLFKDVDTHDIVLVAPTSTHPWTLAAWKGPIIFFNMVHPGIEFMDIVLPTVFPCQGEMCVHGTVGNTATLLAYQMGCKQIIAIGMDLCYGKVGETWKYRCEDFEWFDDGAEHFFWKPKECRILYDNDLRLKQAYEIEVKGKKFMVDPELELYRKSLFELVGSFVNVSFTDCSEGGILGAAGFYTQKFEDALLEHCGRQIQEGESVVLHLPKILQRREQ